MADVATLRHIVWNSQLITEKRMYVQNEYKHFFVHVQIILLACTTSLQITVTKNSMNWLFAQLNETI